MRMRKTMGMWESFFLGIEIGITRDVVFIKTSQMKTSINVESSVMGRMPQTIVPQIIVIYRPKSIVTWNRVIVGKTKEVEALVKVNCTNRLQGTVPLYGVIIRSKFNSAIQRSSKSRDINYVYEKFRNI